MKGPAVVMLQDQREPRVILTQARRVKNLLTWRHPEDSRDFSIQPPPNRPVDEFVLKFQKPK
jgi:hypothetical protein